MRLKGFISYSTRDAADIRTALVAQLKSLERDGTIQVWTDRQLRAGDDWNPKIGRELFLADVALFVISPQALNSDYIDHEFNMARLLVRERGQTVIPVLARKIGYETLFVFAAGSKGVQPLPRLDGWIADFKGQGFANKLAGWCVAVEGALRERLLDPSQFALSYPDSDTLRQAKAAAMTVLAEADLTAYAAGERAEYAAAMDLEGALGAVKGALASHNWDLVEELQTARGKFDREVGRHKWRDEEQAVLTRIRASLDRVRRAALEVGCNEAVLPPPAARQLTPRDQVAEGLDGIVAALPDVQERILQLENRKELDPDPLPALIADASDETQGKAAIIRGLANEPMVDLAGLRVTAAGLAELADGVDAAAQSATDDPAPDLLEQAAGFRQSAKRVEGLAGEAERTRDYDDAISVDEIDELVRDMILRDEPIPDRLARQVRTLDFNWDTIRRRYPQRDQVWLREACGVFNDLRPLSSFKSLRNLYLQHTGVSNITPLDRLLTRREQECLKWAGQGLTDADIGERLGISFRTVNNHIENAKRKLGARNRVGGYKDAVHLGLLNDRVGGLAPLKSLTSLEFLSLASTRISDVSALANLTSLRLLDLSNTRVFDLSPLRDLRALEWIGVTGIPANDLSPIAHVRNVIDLGKRRRPRLPPKPPKR